LANAVVSGVLAAVGPTAPFAFRGPFNVAIWGSQVDALTVTAGSLTASVATGTGLVAGDAINSTLVPPGTTVGAITGTTVTLAIPPITLYGRSHTSPLNQIHTLSSTTGLIGAAVSGPGIASGTTVTGIVRPAISPANEIGSTIPGYPSPAGGQTGQVQLSAAPAADQNLAFPLQPFVFARTGNAITASGTDSAASFTGGAVDYTGSVQLERSFDGGSTWLVCNEPGQSGVLAIYAAGTPINFTAAEPEKNVLYRLNATALSGSNLCNFRISATGQAGESYGLGLLS
jgi:hypothetical protein